jgi:hypothetical protein
MIRYPKRAIVGLAYLFRPYNDIDIYVEDTTCRNMYEVLINRMLDGRAKVVRIFQLGGRREVIDACKKNQGNSNRPRLYVIDGDFAILLGKEAPKLRHLYQLRVYCSENLVFTETAALEVAFESLTNTPRDQVETIVQFSQFLNDIIQKLTPLLVIYIAVRILNPSIQTTGFNVTQLLLQKSGSPELSKRKVKQRVTDIESELHKENPKEEVESTVGQAKRLLPSSNTDTAKLISGKTYLLPLLYHHLRSKTRFSGTLDQLKTRLARYCELDVDPGLLSAVQQASRTRGTQTI